MKTTKHPYEFLARWNAETGEMHAHVGFILTVREDDGALVSRHAMPVQPVAVGSDEGFPLSEVLDALHISLLTEKEGARAENAQLKERVAQLTDQLARVKA